MVHTQGAQRNSLALLTMSTAKNPLIVFELRELLYLMILIGIGQILTSEEVLHEHEAFLASGGLALIALLLLEPRHEKVKKALGLVSIVLSIYGLLLKLPLLLAGTFNYYVTYLLAIVLVAVVNLALFAIGRKYLPSSS